MEYMHGGDIYTYENVTDYSVNLNPFGPGEEVLLAMEESLKHAGEYPDSKSRKLRSALAEHLQVPQEFLIFGNGAAELIFLLTHSLRPKKALLTIPSFAEYHRALQAVDCECVYYPLSEKHGFVPQTSYLELLKEGQIAAFTVVFCLFAVKAVRQVKVMMLRQRHGGSGRNRDPFVSRAKQQIELNAGIHQRFSVKTA